MTVRSLCLASTFAVTLVARLAVAAPCAWPDAPDPSAPKSDPGRGISDWRAHFDHVIKGVGLANAHELVAARLFALKECGDRSSYARVYADASILVAAYGRAGADWKDGADPAAPPDDPGRGVAGWSAHRDHVMVGEGLANAHKLVGDRLLALSRRLPKDRYARLYADLSILLVNHARAR